MPEPVSPPEPEPFAEVSEAEPPETEPEARPAPIPPDDIIAEPAPASALPAEEAAPLVAPLSRSRTTARSKKKPRRGAVVGWAAAAAVVAALAGAVVFREQVARLVPASARLFAAVGLPVDPLGLTIDEVRSVASLQGGRPVLSITGAIRNTRNQTVTVPSLRVSLLDRAGKPVSVKIARPLNPEAPPGAKRYFAIVIPDPPAGSASLDIVFEAPAAPATGEALEARLGADPPSPAPEPEAPAAGGDHG